MPTRSTRDAALADPANHSMTAHGFWRHQPHEALLPGPRADAVATPKKALADATTHLLKPPQGGPGLPFTWLDAPRAWLSHSARGHRLAFTPAYLASHGWTYAGPAPRAKE